MRAEDEKVRIEKARAAIAKLAAGRPLGMMELFDGPVVEWQVRLLKRLQRENMVMPHRDGYHAQSVRMVNLLKAAAGNVPAVVELLWPERARDVLKNLTKMAPVEVPPAVAPLPGIAEYIQGGAVDALIAAWGGLGAGKGGGWWQARSICETFNLGELHPMFEAVMQAQEPDRWRVVGQLLAYCARDGQARANYSVRMRQNGSGNEYSPVPAVPVSTPPPLPPPIEPEPSPNTVPAVVLVLREHGPLSKRELQDKLGGKRQHASQAIEDAIEQGVCFFSNIYGHHRPRVYLQEQFDESRARFDADQAGQAVAVATTTDEQPDGGAPPSDDSVDDDTFKATTLKYIVIYGQNFITVGEHFRVLHESLARLEAKIDALTERLEKKA